MQNETYEYLKNIFKGRTRINQKELIKAGVCSESTAIRRRDMNDLHLLPKFRREGRFLWFSLLDVADFIDGKSSAADLSNTK